MHLCCQCRLVLHLCHVLALLGALVNARRRVACVALADSASCTCADLS
jgi:hypothetical protein